MTSKTIITLIIGIVALTSNSLQAQDYTLSHLTNDTSLASISGGDFTPKAVEIGQLPSNYLNPSKTDAMSDMESMIHHFKLITEGIPAPEGDCYMAIEASKGELGMYVVAEEGSTKPVRWRVRPPSFVNLSVIPKLAEGHLLSDLIMINASLDIVLGEIDR